MHKTVILCCISQHVKGYSLKRILIFCLVLFVFTVSIGTAFAAPEFEGEVKPNAVMLLDATTGKVLFEQNADAGIRPASTTKIMTCIVALENSNLDDVVKVGPEGDWTGSGYSLLGTKNGEEIVMKDLLTGLMLKSGNDAAEAVAVHIAGSVEEFVKMMNKKAAVLGMTGTNFVNPHGVDTDDHIVTARDMSKLSLYAMQNEDFMNIVGTETYVMAATNKNRERTIENTNLLLRTDKENEYYEYATGIKTGSTPKAKRCVVASAEKGGTKLLCLIYGDGTTNGVNRWPLAKELFEFGFENFRTINVQSIIDSVPAVTVEVANSVDEDDVIELTASNTGEELITLETSLAEDIISNNGFDTTVEFYSGTELSAPLKEGDAVGIITFRSTLTKEVICRAQLTATRDVDILGDISLEETEETPAPTPEATQTGAPAEDETKDGFVVGIGWLWLVLAVLLLGVIIFLAISLLKNRG